MFIEWDSILFGSSCIYFRNVIMEGICEWREQVRCQCLKGKVLCFKSLYSYFRKPEWESFINGVFILSVLAFHIRLIEGTIFSF